MRRPFGSVHVSSAGSVRKLSSRTDAGILGHVPPPRTVGVLLGAGRIGLGGIFLVAPEFAVRAVGLDAASARRVVWLSTMTAGRDVALGIGALATAATGRNYSGWVAAGATADAVDSLAIAHAVRTGRLGGVGALGLIGGAAAAAALGFWAAACGRRG